MKHVEIIRNRIVRGQMGELARLRTYISGTEGNQVAVDKLLGQHGDSILAEVTDLIMRRLGHEIETPLADARSRVRQAVSRVRREAD